MFEIKIIGRAGQGAKLATQLLAEVALLGGKYAQAFPEYGPERTGAPVTAYCRVDEREIRAHYPILKPDAVLMLDASLLSATNFNTGAGARTLLIVNAEARGEDVAKKYFWPGEVMTLPASEMARKVLGVDKPNVVLLGALIRKSGVVKKENLEKVLKEIFSKKNKELIEKNIQALEAGYRFSG